MANDFLTNDEEPNLKNLVAAFRETYSEASRVNVKAFRLFTEEHNLEGEALVEFAQRLMPYVDDFNLITPSEKTSIEALKRYIKFEVIDQHIVNLTLAGLLREKPRVEDITQSDLSNCLDGFGKDLSAGDDVLKDLSCQFLMVVYLSAVARVDELVAFKEILVQSVAYASELKTEDSSGVADGSASDIVAADLEPSALGDMVREFLSNSLVGVTTGTATTGDLNKTIADLSPADQIRFCGGFAEGLQGVIGDVDSSIRTLRGLKKDIKRMSGGQASNASALRSPSQTSVISRL